MALRGRALLVVLTRNGVDADVGGGGEGRQGRAIS